MLARSSFYLAGSFLNATNNLDLHHKASAWRGHAIISSTPSSNHSHWLSWAKIAPTTWRIIITSLYRMINNKLTVNRVVGNTQAQGNLPQWTATFQKEVLYTHTPCSLEILNCYDCLLPNVVIGGRLQALVDVQSCSGRSFPRIPPQFHHIDTKYGSVGPGNTAYSEGNMQETTMSSKRIIYCVHGKPNGCCVVTEEEITDKTNGDTTNELVNVLHPSLLDVDVWAVSILDFDGLAVSILNVDGLAVTILDVDGRACVRFPPADVSRLHLLTVLRVYLESNTATGPGGKG
uniref:(California timema) hypothetical protein n=1 Tax=Timema californicum TaxID=61474 RepID=A0A7R9J035_TIMCA|nr:unnamed protein product [Timema californicum]